MDLERLGVELRNRRRTLRMSGTELARRVGISPTYVWLIERARERPSGEPSRPSEDVLADWARALSLNEDETRRIRELAGYSNPPQLYAMAPPPMPSSARYIPVESPFDPWSDSPAAEAPMLRTMDTRIAESSPPLDRDDPVEVERRLVATTRRLLRQAEAAGKTQEVADLFASMLSWLEHHIDRR